VKNKENWEPETDQWALRLHDIIYKLEKKAFSLGFPFAAGLIGGSCKLCQECPGEKDSNAKCIQREKARPSMEAMGIDVLSTCKNAGIEVEFSPEKVIWSGMILLA
jgi:predicted metal-binding protein